MLFNTVLLMLQLTATVAFAFASLLSGCYLHGYIHEHT